MQVFYKQKRVERAQDIFLLILRHTHLIWGSSGKTGGRHKSVHVMKPQGCHGHVFCREKSIVMLRIQIQPLFGIEVANSDADNILTQHKWVWWDPFPCQVRIPLSPSFSFCLPQPYLCNESIFFLGITTRHTSLYPFKACSPVLFCKHYAKFQIHWVIRRLSM